MKGKQKFYLLIALYQIILVFVVFFSVNGLITVTVAQSETLQYYQAATAGMLGMSAAIAVGLAVIGSGLAIKTVGTSAIAALTEREESYFKAFLIVALAEALAVYGLIIAILLWTKIPQP